MKAVELLGKLSHVGAFVERSEVTTIGLSGDAIKARIEELLTRV